MTFYGVFYPLFYYLFLFFFAPGELLDSDSVHFLAILQGRDVCLDVPAK